MVWIQVFVNWCIGFFYLSMGSRLECHVEIIGKVPSQGEFPVPQKLFTECQRQTCILSTLQITLLQFVITTGHLTVERNILRQIIDTYLFREVEPFTFTLGFGKWLKCLIGRRIIVIQSTAPVVFFLIHCSFTACILMTMTI